MLRRLLLSLSAACAGLWLLAGPAGATEAGPVEVVEVEGPLDALAVRFVERSVRTATGAQVVILQIDSPGSLTPEVERLVDLLQEPPVPVAVWVGPSPAVAYGGAARMLAAAPIRLAAPGTRLGYLSPLVAGRPDPPPARIDGLPPDLLDGVVEVEGPVPGLVDEVVPSIGQVVVGLHGREVAVGGETVRLATAEPTEGAALRPSVAVRFHSPPLWVRLLRLAVRPEAAFFFLAAGLTVVAFEFYALGPGIAGAVGLTSLLLGGYGLVTLPVVWWAVVLVVGGIGALAADFQRGGLGPLSLGGLAALILGGFRLTDAAPQLVPAWWAVLLTVAGVAAFFGVAMTAVVRARFSTPAIGRGHLVGRRGRAVTDLTPEGVVAVGEGRWKAVSHREAGIRAGDPVRVVGVRGLTLRVEPAGDLE